MQKHTHDVCIGSLDANAMFASSWTCQHWCDQLAFIGFLSNGRRPADSFGKGTAFVDASLHYAFQTQDFKCWLTMAAEPPPLPANWHLNLTIYPPFREIVEALQDPGIPKNPKTKLAKQTGVQKRKCIKIAKIATQVYKQINDSHNPGAQLDDNVSRGKNTLHMEILQSRKHVDTSDTHVAFHSHGVDGKVHIVYNNPRFAGQDLAIRQTQLAHQLTIKARKAQRTQDDGIRLAGVLFHPDHRAAVDGIMTNKKDRKKSDVKGDTTRNFFSHALKDFADPNFQVSHPREEHWSSEHLADDRDKWDPNNPAIFEHPRAADWLKDTSFTHIRPRCKRALDKWNKETGGGDGTQAAFVHFCGNERWLV